ncbi:MAG: serine/threonine protein kinase [Polyangiaceae bacterium]|nr:serine/threonine protein kinase [Polyangiaceae bacterium]
MIASGGMATVHLARAHGAGGFQRFVALKVMHPHIESEPEFVQMFLDEARLAARIHHPNVVGTSDVQQDESGLFLVMDYVDGPALQVVLRALWQKGERMPLDVVLRIFLDALAGLHAAHELTDANGDSLHLVHRDVSPQNILVGSDGVARLTDFGVARARSRLVTTECGQLKGKLTYMAPEQVRSELLDRRADIYAAGVVLWEMLASERLMRGDNDGAIVERILAGISRSPRDVVPSVPEPLAAVCMRALCFEKEGRFPTAAAFAEAVEAAAHEAGIVVATPRAVSALLKELHIESSMASIRAVSGEVKTLTALASELPTVRERVTSPDSGGAHSSSPTSQTSRPALDSTVSRDASASHDASASRDEATRATFAGRLRGKRNGMLVGVGLLVLALAGWGFISGLRSGEVVEEAMTVTVPTGMPSLAPPSAIMAPDVLPNETATRTNAGQGAALKETEPQRSKPGKAAVSGGAKMPPPSATAFRPRDL